MERQEPDRGAQLQLLDDLGMGEQFRERHRMTVSRPRVRSGAMLWWNRPDGELVRDLPPTKQIMPYIMRGRNESAFYFEQQISLAKTDALHPRLQRRAPVDADRRAAHPDAGDLRS